MSILWLDHPDPRHFTPFETLVGFVASMAVVAALIGGAVLVINALGWMGL